MNWEDFIISELKKDDKLLRHVWDSLLERDHVIKQVKHLLLSKIVVDTDNDDLTELILKINKIASEE